MAVEVEEVDAVMVAEGDLVIAIAMLQTMYNVLHEDQPECCGEGADLIVKTNGQTRNITKHVPLVIEHLTKILAD